MASDQSSLQNPFQKRSKAHEKSSGNGKAIDFNSITNSSVEDSFSLSADETSFQDLNHPHKKSRSISDGNDQDSKEI